MLVLCIWLVDLWQKGAGQGTSSSVGCVSKVFGESLVVQWLRLHAPNAGDLGLTPGQGSRSHIEQLKIPCAATKTQCNQINTFLKIWSLWQDSKNSRMSSLWKGAVGIVAEGMRYLAALTGVLPSWETNALFLWMNLYIKAGPHRSVLPRLLCSICDVAELPQGYGRITECAARDSFHIAPCYRNSQERVLANSGNSWRQEQSECECTKPCSSNGAFRCTQGVGMMWRRDDTFWLFRKGCCFFFGSASQHVGS